jgi:protein-S-isoprenylcysteine O-methyltransferase Ste14
MTQTPWLKILAYMWAIFGAYWIVLAPWLARPRFYLQLPPLVLIPSFVLLLLLRNAIPTPALVVLVLSWVAVGLFWARPAGTAAKDEPSIFRFLRLAILGLTFALLFWDRTRIGALGKVVLPPLPAIALTGFVLVCCGLAVAVWARAYLGGYWSDKVMLQLEHRLIESGPYAYVRHPIYSGVLLAVFGTALVEGQWRGVLAFLILLINYSIKAKREERVLAEHFRPRFHHYVSHAGFLLPRFRSRLERS